mgnify:CR=1 FL=1
MKSYLRFLSRNKLYTAIEVVGLSIALAFVIIFTCYVKQQTAVNKHYPDSDRIYLVGFDTQTYSFFAMADELERDIPEIESAVRVQNYYNPYTYEGEISSDQGILVIGKDFFELFPTRFLHGSPEVLNVKDNALVTESFARRHGMEEVIGKKLIDGDKEMIISGIIEDFTSSVFDDFEIILTDLSVSNRDNYFNSAIMTFVKISKGADFEQFEGKITEKQKEFFRRIQYPKEYPANLIRLDKLYLSELNNGMTGLKCESRDRIIIFSLVVLFLLISAVINYVNLNVANAEKRSKEIAIRHILGAERGAQIFRTILESFVFTAVSFIFALLMASLLIDPINSLLQTEILVVISLGWEYLCIYILLITVTAAICGIAVSMAVTRIKVTSSTRARRSMSGIFMALQFVISFIMISVSITMEMQMKHMIGRDMNANTDNIYRTNVDSPDLLDELQNLPFVRSIGKSTGYPGYFGMSLNYADDSPTLSLMFCDSTAFRIFGFEIVHDFKSGNPYGTWMCESAANHHNVSQDKMTWDSPGFNGMTSEVTGIIKDAPVTSVLNTDFNAFGHVTVVAPENVTWGGYILEVDETLEHKHILDSLVTTLYMAESGRDASGYGFINDLNKAEYDRTRKDMRLLELFMFVAIMLSCLAFLAMSMHYASGNTKPIAVHKVFGGSTASELRRCMNVYLKIIAAAIVIGLPPSIWICERYIQQFSYRIDLGEKWWIFLTAMAVSLLISTATVLWQTLRAARTNPAEALKKE